MELVEGLELADVDPRRPEGEHDVVLVRLVAPLIRDLGQAVRDDLLVAPNKDVHVSAQPGLRFHGLQVEANHPLLLLVREDFEDGALPVLS